MKILISILTTISILLSFQSSKATTTIEGNAKDYANQTLRLYKYTDQIGMQEEVFLEISIGWDGDFYESIELKEPIYCFLYSGHFKGFIYLEPNEKYKLKLPPASKLSDSEKLNPYFKYNEVYLKIEDKDDEVLNTNIAKFDQMYGEYFNENAIFLYRKKKPKNLDRFFEKTNQKFFSIKNDFFNTYKQCRLAYLEYISSPHLLKKIFTENFISKKAVPENPAYMTLMREIGLPYFNFINKKNKADNLYAYISEVNGDVKELRAKLSLVSNIDDKTLLEIWITQILYDGYFKKSVSLSDATNLLASLAENTSQNNIKKIVTSVRKKMLHLKPGTDAPNFNLNSYRGKFTSLQHFKDKYVYLNFCTFESYTCKSDFAILKNLYDKHKDKLEIVSICIDKSWEENIKTIKKEKYKWTFLGLEDGRRLLKKYNVNAYPTYYLISPSSTMALSPAPSPSEDFEYHFFKIWKENRYNKQKGE